MSKINLQSGILTVENRRSREKKHLLIRVQIFTLNPDNTQGEVTLQNLRPRYYRHFVGIKWHNVWSYIDLSCDSNIN